MSISTNSDPLAHPRADAVAVDADVLRVVVRDGRTIAPLAWFGWLASASVEQRRDFAIIGGAPGSGGASWARASRS